VLLKLRRLQRQQLRKGAFSHSDNSPIYTSLLHRILPSQYYLFVCHTSRPPTTAESLLSLPSVPSKWFGSLHPVQSVEPWNHQPRGALNRVSRNLGKHAVPDALSTFG
jgi:hypothetical protein